MLKVQSIMEVIPITELSTSLKHPVISERGFMKRIEMNNATRGPNKTLGIQADDSITNIL